MGKRTPKTEGLTWVEFSLMAFNGSGYADRETKEAFLESYIDYNRWKKRNNAVLLANEYYHALLPLAETLLSSAVLKKPSPKNWAKFQNSKQNTALL